MHGARKLALAVLVTAVAGTALAQERGRRPSFGQHMDRPGFQRHEGRMSGEQRQRFREELNSTRREIYRDAGPAARDAQRAEMQRMREERMRRLGDPQRMSPEERAQLQRDIREANRDIERQR